MSLVQAHFVHPTRVTSERSNSWYAARTWAINIRQSRVSFSPRTAQPSSPASPASGSEQRPSNSCVKCFALVLPGAGTVQTFAAGAAPPAAGAQNSVRFPKRIQMPPRPGLGVVVADDSFPARKSPDNADSAKAFRSPARRSGTVPPAPSHTGRSHTPPLVQLQQPCECLFRNHFPAMLPSRPATAQRARNQKHSERRKSSGSRRDTG